MMSVEVPHGVLGSLALGLVALGLLNGCALGDLRKQTRMAESIGRIDGQVVVATGLSGAVHVVLFKPGSVDTEFVIVADEIADRSGDFHVSAEAGTYFVGSFQDVNGDGAHQRDTEPASYFNNDGLLPTPFTLKPSGRLTLEPLPLVGLLKGVPDVRAVDGSPAVTRNIGRIVSLNDSMFSAANATMGLWRPVDFLLQVGGGIFMLQAYRPDAIPVIFIHGINGTPDNFRSLVGMLDMTRFQPWVLHYPSGLRLDLVSDYLDRALAMLHARHGFAQVYVVAHSMGGLVARSFVMKHEQRSRSARIGLMMTVNSPMLGMGSANLGVEYSPIVLPVWRDVAANSGFIRQLQSARWPASIPYHLMFSYQPGKGGDGVVPLESQIPLGLQEEAVRLYGFQATHAGILNDRDFLRRFSSVMAGP